MGMIVGPALGADSTKTCGEIKEFYRSNACCGNADQTVSGLAAACPYNFALPTCATAEPQAPRDLTIGAQGFKVPKAPTLNVAQSALLPLANVHYHLGAEHKSNNYNDATLSNAWDTANAGRRLADNVRPGFMCPTTSLTSEEMTDYTFQYCKGDVKVGQSYEIHYVHSSAGYTEADIAGADIDLMDDGLGGAANGRGQLNPQVVVQAQIFQIVNDANAPTDNDLLHGWEHIDHTDSVMYAGSTTGPSHNNQYCSPYAITWHVDKACHKISAASFDNLCKQMKDMYNLEGDLYPHASRVLVDPAYVVPDSYVNVLA